MTNTISPVFRIGIVDKDRIIDNTKMREGDVIIALPSSGVHSNGFSLVRKVIIKDENSLSEYIPELSSTIGEALLTPTKIYVKPILALLDKVDVKGISHITGGGFYENVPRSLPEGLYASIEKAAVRVLPLFVILSEHGNIPEHDMFNTFNMGVGMSVVVPVAQVDLALELLKSNGENAYVIGEVKAGEKGVRIW